MLEKLYERLVGRPYEQVVGWLRERIAGEAVVEPDLDALALIMIEPMSSYRSMESTLRRVPGEVSDERLVATRVEVCLAYARSIGLHA